MKSLFSPLKVQIENSRKIDQAFDDKLRIAAQLLWPWRDRWLSVIVLVITLLDFGSTYLFLEYKGAVFAYESGLLASWALNLGGMRWLLLLDIIAGVTLISTASALRYLLFRRNLNGYARTCFIVLQLPYVLVTAAAAINNILLSFLI